MAIGFAIGRDSTATIRRTIGISAASAYLVAVVVVFGYFYPILTAKNITYGEWHNRMWLRTCQSHPDTHQENAPCWI
jgi:dolichyl-phosphate-mannose--protein O-mannosyl transferase